MVTHASEETNNGELIMTDEEHPLTTLSSVATTIKDEEHPATTLSNVATTMTPAKSSTSSLSLANQSLSRPLLVKSTQKSNMAPLAPTTMGTTTASSPMSQPWIQSRGPQYIGSLPTNSTNTLGNDRNTAAVAKRPLLPTVAPQPTLQNKRKTTVGLTHFVCSGAWIFVSRTLFV